MGEEGIKNGQKNSDVFYGWPPRGLFRSGIFRHMDFSHGDISALELFDTRTFQHWTLRGGYLSTLGNLGTMHSNMDVSAQGHFDTVLKCTYVKISQCCNIPMLECPWRHNVHLPERPQS